MSSHCFLFVCCPHWLLIRNQLLFLLKFPWTWQDASCSFQNSHFSFGQFDCDMSKCWSLWVYHSWNILNFVDGHVVVFPQIWGVFCHYFFKYFFGSFSLFSPVTSIMSIMVCLWCHTSLWGSVHCLCSLFLSFFSGRSAQLTYFSVLLIFTCCWAPLVKFSFWLLYFSTPDFLFGPIKIISTLYWYSSFGEILFSYYLLVLWVWFLKQWLEGGFLTFLDNICSIFALWGTQSTLSQAV